MAVAMLSGCSDTQATDEDEALTEPEVPLSCESVGLPADRGRSTWYGHFTTAFEFGIPEIGERLGIMPDPADGVLVLATHPHYDCNVLFQDVGSLNGETFATQSVYIFEGLFEMGTYEVGTDVTQWGAEYLGDGEGNGGGSSGEFNGGEITISTTTSECVTGIAAGLGFAVTPRQSCFD
ncbi:MAG: hypothetical protein AAF799_22495 [Myxococcota bacterium]